MQSLQPLTPAGRLYSQPLIDQIIYCAVAVDFPFDVDALIAGVQRLISLKPPRFCSLLVRDSRGRETWQRTAVKVDRHVFILHHRLSDDLTVSDEDAVNDYIAELSVSSPLPTDKPLWEIHLLQAHGTAVFRVHHAIGDGVSLMSLLLSCCRKSDDPAQLPTIGGIGSGSPVVPWRRRGLCTLLMVAWYTLVHVLQFILRVFWVRDKITALSGGAGVELWPRKLATARFRLHDMKVVKRAVPHATLNDVLMGVISCGLSRLQDILELIHTKSGNRWGNKFGVLILPIYYYHDTCSDPIQFVNRAKASMDKKKLSLEALFSYLLEFFALTFFGAKVASFLSYRFMCNTSFWVSNIAGPMERVSLMGNPVKHIRVTSNSQPHAITMHMVSYADMANLQILVAKEMVPDPKILAKCFEDALLEMKAAVQTTIEP